MKASANSLFSRVQRPLRRALLTLTPLAALGLLATDTARAVVSTFPYFSPNGTVTYGSDSKFSPPTGTLAGFSLPQGSNNVTGANYYGGPISYAVSSVAVGSGTLQAFYISGSASGYLGTTSDEFSGFYHFDLETSSSLSLPITGWTLTYAVHTSNGSSTGSASGVDTGDISGTVLFPISYADLGSSLTSYSAILSVSYTDAAASVGSTLSVTVPNGSIDFNAVPATSVVPEPGTWALLLLGGVAAGVRAARVRRC